MRETGSCVKLKMQILGISEHFLLVLLLELAGYEIIDNRCA
jgi:hypothetical protein